MLRRAETYHSSNGFNYEPIGFSTSQSSLRRSETFKLGPSNMGQSTTHEFTDQRASGCDIDQRRQAGGEELSMGSSFPSSSFRGQFPMPEREWHMQPGSTLQGKNNNATNAFEPSPWIPLQQQSASSSSRYMGHQYPLATHTSACHVSEADCPKPDHRAAHVLTVLRSGYDQGTSCFSGTMATLCQQQVCTKDDCPPDTQVRCPSEDIDIQQCDGNCAGRLCSGVGCPYNIPCALVQSPFETYDSPVDDLWSCASPHIPNHRSAPSYRGPFPQHYGFNYDTKGLDHLFPCSDHHCQGSTLTQSHPQPIIRNDIVCSTTSECCDLWEPCEEPSCNFEEFCNFHTQGDDCLLAHCDQASTILDKGKALNKVSPIPQPALDTGHPFSPINSSSNTTPFSTSDSDSKTSGTKVMCKWVTNQSSGEVCGYCCEHGNDLQAHIEHVHINTPASKVGARQKKGSSRQQKDLLCRWQGCKYHLQKKSFGQTQSLKQHTYTHSGCEFYPTYSCH
jgi:hypothetical protein